MRFLRSSLLLIFILFLSSCNSGSKSPSNNSKTFYCLLSTQKVQHKLYQPGDQNIPRPFSKYYTDMADDKVYPYPDACGSATFLFDPDTKELHYTIAYSGLSGTPIMLHFHLGNSRTEGPIIQTIFGEPYEDVKGLGNSTERPLYGKRGPNGRAAFITGVYKLEGNPLTSPPLSAEDEVQSLMDGDIYLNVHTYLNQAGEIRGQIEPCRN